TFAWAQLSLSGEQGLITARHAQWFCELAERVEPLLLGAEQQRWFAQLGREMGNLRAALVWAAESARPELILRPACALSEYWDAQGLWAEALDWLERGLAGAVSDVLRAKALLIASQHACWSGNVARSAVYAEAALSLARSLGERSLAGLALGVLA